jgi:hypothetical protein
VLPDTGLGAGGTANVSFIESEPNRDLDDTWLIVWTSPAATRPFADDPPRVRVLTDDGRVFLDLQSTPAAAGSWYVKQAIAPGSVRDAIVAAFQAGQAVVEFSTTQPIEKVTRVRPIVRFAGRNPVAICL